MDLLKKLFHQDIFQFGHQLLHDVHTDNPQLLIYEDLSFLKNAFQIENDHILEAKYLPRKTRLNFR